MPASLFVRFKVSNTCVKEAISTSSSLLTAWQLCTSKERSPPSFRACVSFCLLLALVNGTMPAFSIAATAAAAASNPAVLHPALPTRETNPWAANPVGPAAPVLPGKRLCRETEISVHSESEVHVYHGCFVTLLICKK